MSEYPLDWTISNLGAYLAETKERAGDSNAIPYSVSKVLGIVPQSEKFNKRVASSDISNYKVIRKGDFAYDPMLLWDGSINRMLREGKGAVSPAYVTFRVTSNSLDADYLLHLLKASTTKNFYKSISKGTNVRRQKAEFGDFAGGEFAFPPLPEQKKIAEILSGTQGNLNLVAQEIAKLDNLEKCLLSSLFSENEGGEWKKVAVSDIGRVIRGASPRPKGDPRYYGGRVPRLMVADVTRDGKYVTPRIDFLTEAGAKLSRPVPAGTLTIVCSGVVGVPSILSVDACIHDGFLAIVDISPECNAEYLYYFFRPLQQILDSSATHGGIFTNLTTEILKDFPVLLPSPARQGEIVKILRSIDSLRNGLLTKQSKYACLLESISTDLLSGRKRVSV